jgi:alpha-ribazole phosphatase
LVRAAESARCAGLDPHIDADLRETDFGEWEQKSFEEAAESAPPGLIDKWAVFDHDFRFPQGERLGDFLERVAGATDRLAAINAETVVVMTHGGVIRTMICHLLGIDPRHYLLFNVDHASITTLSIHQGRGVLAELNDTCHLKGVS